MISKYFLGGVLAGGMMTILCQAVALYYWCSPIGNPSLYSLFLFAPSKAMYPEGTKIDGCVAKEVNFPAKNNNLLNGRLYLKPKAKQIVIYNHGKGGNITFFVTKLKHVLEAGEVSVFVYDYQGFGKSTGKPSVANVISDAKAAYDYVLSHTEYKPEQIILYGESLGTGITSQLALGVKCAGIVLDSPFTSPELLGKETFPIMQIYPSHLFREFNLSNMEMVRGKHPPLLIVHGKEDTTIPVHHAQYLYDTASQPKELKVLDWCAHCDFEPKREEFLSSLQSFFKRCRAKSELCFGKS
ncbi:MAG: alpha/beta hydrolase [Cyanobacteria bacterium]|nr:alpha/beta hydrolase [Cyanobacteriota bacterium]